MSGRPTILQRRIQDGNPSPQVQLILRGYIQCRNVSRRWRLEWKHVLRRQDSAEHDECYIGVSAGRGKTVVFLEVDYTAVELDDVVVRRRRFPRREVFAEGVEKRCIAPRTDSVSAEQNNLTFLRPKLPRRDGSTEQDMNCFRVSANYIKGDYTASKPDDHLCRRWSLPPNRVVVEVGGSVYKHRKFFHRPDPTPVVCAAGRNDVQRTSDGVTRSWISPKDLNDAVFGGQPSLLME